MRVPMLMSICLLAVLVISLCNSTPLRAAEDIYKPDKDGKTPLIRAAFDGATNRVKALIAAQAKVNTKAKDGSTALMAAAGNGHADCVNALIAAKAEVNAQDNEGMTALMWASQNGYRGLHHRADCRQSQSQCPVQRWQYGLDERGAWGGTQRALPR